MLLRLLTKLGEGLVTPALDPALLASVRADHPRPTSRSPGGRFRPLDIHQP